MFFVCLIRDKFFALPVLWNIWATVAAEVPLLGDKAMGMWMDFAYGLMTMR